MADIRICQQISHEVQDFFEEEQQNENEELRKRVAQAAEEALKAVRKSALCSANIMGMVNAEDGAVMDWMYKTLPPQNSQVEVRPAGGPAKGGGSKSRRKKDKKGHKIFLDPWTGI